MAKITIRAEITVEGRNIKSRKSAVNELQDILDVYWDNNREEGNEITIKILSAQKES